MEDNFSTAGGGGKGGGGGVGEGSNAIDGEQQMKFLLLACRSPPAVRPGSKRAAARYQSADRGLGIPVLQNPLVPQGFILTASQVPFCMSVGKSVLSLSQYYGKSRSGCYFFPLTFILS